jgi:hypothetical protein
VAGDRQKAVTPPKTPLGKGLGYIDRQSTRLLLFLDDGNIEATNNRRERELRRLVLRRKNWLFTWLDDGDVLGWTKEESPDDYEIIWAKIADRPHRPPSTFQRLGFEPTYFTSDHFSAVCDCMCFPRWHGTDREGELFRPYSDRLNANGLFDDASSAAEFLAYYLSVDWTERGEYEIAEVCAPATQPSAALAP